MQELIITTENITKNVRQINQFTGSTPYIISNTLINSVIRIIPNLTKELKDNPKKISKYTKQLAYGIGVVSSLFVSAQYTGVEYVLSFTLNVINNSAITYIINKLNELNIVDGISIAVILGCLSQLPKFILSVVSKGFIEGILSILAIYGLGYINYKLLKHENNLEVNFANGTKDKIDISAKSSYSMVICSLYYISVLLGKLGINNVIISGLVMLLSPLLTYCMATGTGYDEEVNKYLKHNNAYIKDTRHDTDTLKLINNELLKESIKQGVIGGLVLMMSMVIVKALELNISPLYISLLVNSLMSVSFSVKSVIKEKSIKGFLNIQK